jgi:hypothetical protein
LRTAPTPNQPLFQTQSIKIDKATTQQENYQMEKPNHPYTKHLNKAKALATEGQLKTAQIVLAHGLEANKTTQIPLHLLLETEALQEEMLIKHLCHTALTQDETDCLELLHQNHEL